MARCALMEDNCSKLYECGFHGGLQLLVQELLRFSLIGHMQRQGLGGDLYEISAKQDTTNKNIVKMCICIYIYI